MKTVVTPSKRTLTVRNRIGESLRNMCLLVLLTLMCSQALTVRRAAAQRPPCSVANDPRDSIAYYDSVSTGCYRFRIINRGWVNNKITGFSITTLDPTKSVGWLCSIVQDTNGTNDRSGLPGNHGHFYANTFNGVFVAGPPAHWDFTDPLAGLPGDTASLDICDSGWIKLCICCSQTGALLNMPLVITTIHQDGTRYTDTVNRVFSPLPCGGHHSDCDKSCDGFDAATTVDPLTKRTHLCLTVHERKEGNLISARFNFTCNDGSGHQMRYWVPDGSVPNGFHLTYDDQAKLVITADSLNGGIPNCGNVTFCFVDSDCVNLACTHEQITMVTNDDSLSCYPVPSADIYLDLADTECCPGSAPRINHTTPMQEPVLGRWSFCINVHRADGLGMNSLTINKLAGRCIKLTSIPFGWSLTSIPGAWPETFQHAGYRDSVGCRTFEFCYETCDCSQTNSTVSLSVSGENLLASTQIIPIPPDGGLCCSDDHRWLHDHVIVTHTSSNCLTYTLYNTHYPCSYLNDFHFVLPAICNFTSVTVPAGYTYTFDAITRTINVVPTLTSGAQFTCCQSLAVVVCFDCSGTFPAYSFGWQSTYNGTIVTDSTQDWGGGGERRNGVDEEFTISKSNGEQNFPNPFGSNSSFKTSIPFSTKSTGVARVTVVDETGKVVLTQDQSVAYAGKHYFYFTGQSLPAGRYFYQIEFPAGKTVITNRTMILVR